MPKGRNDYLPSGDVSWSTVFTMNGMQQLPTQWWCFMVDSLHRWDATITYPVVMFHGRQSSPMGRNNYLPSGDVSWSTVFTDGMQQLPTQWWCFMVDSPHRWDATITYPVVMFHGRQSSPMGRNNYLPSGDVSWSTVFTDGMQQLPTQWWCFMVDSLHRWDATITYPVVMFHGRQSSPMGCNNCLPSGDVSWSTVFTDGMQQLPTQWWCFMVDSLHRWDATIAYPVVMFHGRQSSPMGCNNYLPSGDVSWFTVFTDGTQQLPTQWWCFMVDSLHRWDATITYPVVMFHGRQSSPMGCNNYLPSGDVSWSTVFTDGMQQLPTQWWCFIVDSLHQWDATITYPVVMFHGWQSSPMGCNNYLPSGDVSWSIVLTDGMQQLPTQWWCFMVDSLHRWDATITYPVVMFHGRQSSPMGCNNYLPSGDVSWSIVLTDGMQQLPTQWWCFMVDSLHRWDATITYPVVMFHGRQSSPMGCNNYLPSGDVSWLTVFTDGMQQLPTQWWCFMVDSLHRWDATITYPVVMFHGRQSSPMGCNNYLPSGDVS